MLEGVNKKTMIQVVIIVAAFSAAGLILYNGFFKSNNQAAVQTSGVPGGFVQPTSTQDALLNSAVPGGFVQPTTAQNILPYGDTLDFSKALDRNRFQYNQIIYPQLNSQNDVGISPDSLIIPIPVTQPTKSR